jgi:hypothetical protein
MICEDLQAIIESTTANMPKREEEEVGDLSRQKALLRNHTRE